MALIRTSRDLRVDFFRGVALWWIFTDHIDGDVLGDLSLRNFTLCDATEVFVLLAGYAAGIAYGRVLDRQGWLSSGADVVRRAWTLYIAHIFLFVVFTAQVAYSAQTFDRADYLDEIHLDVLGDDPYHAMLQALILHFQPAYLNILPLYVVLLVMFAMVLPLLRRPVLLGGLSLLVYAAVRVTEFNLPSWTGGGWFFNPFAWQVLFMFGAILSYATIPAEGRVVRLVSRVFDVAAGMVLVLGALVIQSWSHPEMTAHLPRHLVRLFAAVDKTGLHPYRLISILALAWAVRRLVPDTARWLRGRIAAPFVITGQHSLPVFCSGIFLAFLGRLAMEQDDGWLMQVAVNGLGALALVAVGALAAWYRAKGGERSQNNDGGRPASLPVTTRPDIA